LGRRVVVGRGGLGLGWRRGNVDRVLGRWLVGGVGRDLVVVGRGAGGVELRGRAGHLGIHLVVGWWGKSGHLVVGRKTGHL